MEYLVWPDQSQKIFSKTIKTLLTDLSHALHYRYELRSPSPCFSLATTMPNQMMRYPLENDPALSSLVCSDLTMAMPNQMINYPPTYLRMIQLYQVRITLVTSTTTKPNQHSEAFYLVLNDLAEVKIALSKLNSKGRGRFILPKMWYFFSLSLKWIYKTLFSKHTSRRGIL